MIKDNNIQEKWKPKKNQASKKMKSAVREREPDNKE